MFLIRWRRGTTFSLSLYVGMTTTARLNIVAFLSPSPEDNSRLSSGRYSRDEFVGDPVEFRTTESWMDREGEDVG